MKLRCYLSGPMSNIPGLNFPAFHAEAARLRALGHDVVNPAEINSDPGVPWEVCLKDDIRALLTCDSIVMLPDWECSRGATLEHHIATALGMKVFMASWL